GGGAGGIKWTAVHETERCNRLPLKRLTSEVQRHQPLIETRSSEFESLPPSQLTHSSHSLVRRLVGTFSATSVAPSARRNGVESLPPSQLSRPKASPSARGCPASPTWVYRRDRLDASPAQW